MNNNDNIEEENSLNVTFEDDKLDKNKKPDTCYFKEKNKSPEKVNEQDAKYLESFNSNINSIQSKIIELINNEKENISNEVQTISRLKQKLNDFKNNENLKLKKEKESWLNTFYKDNNVVNEIIDLNIGGTVKLSTTRATLTKFPFSALSLLFSGNYDLPKYENRIFIDRDGEPFSHMISYLRTGKYPIFKEKFEESNFFQELEFWKIPISTISISDRQEEFDPDWCAPTLNLEGNNNIIRKNSK